MTKARIFIYSDNNLKLDCFRVLRSLKYAWSLTHTKILNLFLQKNLPNTKEIFLCFYSNTLLRKIGALKKKLYVLAAVDNVLDDAHTLPTGGAMKMNQSATLLLINDSYH